MAILKRLSYNNFEIEDDSYKAGSNYNIKKLILVYGIILNYEGNSRRALI